MTDTAQAAREAALSRLPELQASTIALSGLLQSLLTPATAAALSSGEAVDTALIAVGDAPVTASELLRDIDSRLPALRVARPIETTN